MRGRSGHNKAKPQLGRISALAGRKSRLRACKLILQRYLLTYPAWPDLSNPRWLTGELLAIEGFRSECPAL